MSKLQLNTTNLLSIEINYKPKPQYDAFFGNDTPYYFPGEQIRGTVKYESEKSGSTIKHRGIYVNLCHCIYKKNQLIKSKLIGSIQLKEPGTVISPYSMYFSFLTSSDLSPSFVGDKYTYSYIIVASLHKTLKHIDVSTPIAVISPIAELPSKPDIRLAVTTDQMTAKFIVERSVFWNNSIIDCLFNTTSIKQDTIESINLQLISMETYKDENAKSVLVDYQFIDGCPRVGLDIPFTLDIRYLKLWPPTNQPALHFNSSYAFRILIRTNNSGKWLTKEIPIEICQPKQ